MHDTRGVPISSQSSTLIIKRCSTLMMTATNNRTNCCRVSSQLPINRFQSIPNISLSLFFNFFLIDSRLDKFLKSTIRTPPKDYLKLTYMSMAPSFGCFENFREKRKR